MPRVKSEIPRGAFVLQNSPNSRGERAIYIRYFVTGKYARRSTDIWVMPDDWDNKKEEVKAKHKSATSINTKLKNIKKRVDDQILNYKEGMLTFAVVQKMLDGAYIPEEEKAKATYLIEYCNEVNELLYSNNKYSYSVYYNGKLSIRQFAEYITDKLHIEPLTLNQITPEIMAKYIKYRKDERHCVSNEGINKSITPIIRAVKYAVANGILPQNIGGPVCECYIDIKERVYLPKDAEEERMYLTDKEIESIKNYEPKNNRAYATKAIIDVFLFSYYACGLRISDLVTLEWNNIDFKKGIINKVQVKTKKKGKISPILCPQAIEILNRWKDKGLNKRFVFNYLPEDYEFGESKDKQHELKMRINAVDRNINTSLKPIGEKIGYPNLSIHTARHSFCVKALSTMQLHVVSQLMGHSSVLATEKTYADFLETTVDKEMEKVKSLFK